MISIGSFFAKWLYAAISMPVQEVRRVGTSCYCLIDSSRYFLVLRYIITIVKLTWWAMQCQSIIFSNTVTQIVRRR